MTGTARYIPQRKRNQNGVGSPTGQKSESGNTINGTIANSVPNTVHSEANKTATGRLTMADAKQHMTNTAQLMKNAAYVFPPIAQSMNKLLNQIEKQDFFELAGIDPNDEKAKLKVSDYYVLVAQQVLDMAKRNQWNICRRYDFFYFYSGSHWQVVNEDELRHFLKEAAEKMGVAWLKARSVDFAKKLLEQFTETAYLPAPEVNPDRVLINLQNGTFDITAQKHFLRTPDATDFLTHQLPFAYNDRATCPKFDAFLSEVLPDTDCRNLLAEYLGYIFVNPAKLKLEKVMLLYGSGANGKSVFFEIVMKLLGHHNVSNYSLEKLTTEAAYRAKIQDKKLNYASEISGNLDSTVFKALASGEPVEARLLYGQAFIMTNYAKLLANTNELPNSPEQTHAFFRRFIIIPFNITIPESRQNKRLAEEICDTELSGVFNWVLNGLRRLLKQQRFTESKVVEEQLEIYKKQSDSVRLFLDESQYAVTPKSYVFLKALYQEYRGYCIESGMPPVKKPNFQKRLHNVGVQTARLNAGNVVYISRSDLPI